MKLCSNSRFFVEATTLRRSVMDVTMMFDCRSQWNTGWTAAKHWILSSEVNKCKLNAILKANYSHSSLLKVFSFPFCKLQLIKCCVYGELQMLYYLLRRTLPEIFTVCEMHSRRFIPYLRANEPILACFLQKQTFHSKTTNKSPPLDPVESPKDDLHVIEGVLCYYLYNPYTTLAENCK